MQSDELSGIYAAEMLEYINYRKALGYKCKDTLSFFRQFDKLTIEREETKIGITKELFDEWAHPSSTITEATRYSRMIAIRKFSFHLRMIGYESYVVPFLPKYKSTFLPHIYTKHEIDLLFLNADRMRMSHNLKGSSVCVMPLLLRILYGTGIRISEALNLRHKDVDLLNGLLIIRESKNGQERILPMSLSITASCLDYRRYKETLGLDTEPQEYFFTTPAGSRCHISTIYSLFRTLLIRAGIHHGGRGKGPRLHDLRHTFCVESMAQMVNNGYDLYYVMPILMTYMGHQSLDATNKYVRITKDMFPGIQAKLTMAYQTIYPELNEELTNENY